ncbi:MAG: hypothetical protein EOM24_14145 [Chloroflexia bacterium]|nr:hypothetical protein [Chloroflexia bacterium]
MMNIRQFATQTGFGNRPISVRSLLEKFEVNSLYDAIASYKISDLHRRTGGNFGSLGAPVSGLNKQSNEDYNREFQLGSIHLNNVNGIPKANTYFDVEVKLSAVKCFGTDDHVNDEIYLVISLISINPNFGHVDKLAHTMRTEIDSNVKRGKVFFKQKSIGALRAFPGSGIKIYVAVFDQEHGDADDLRDKIHAVLEDAANKGAQLIAGVAASGNQQLAGPVGDVMEFEVGGVKPFKILTLGLADVLSDWLSDDMLGEHEFIIPAQNIIDLSKQAAFDASFRRHPETLGSDVQFNWPRTDADEFIFSGGGGSYKVYFTITPLEVTRPLEPRIP